MTTKVLVLVKYPEGARLYEFEADEATVEDLKHAHSRSCYLDDDEPFMEEFAEQFEEYEVEEDNIDRSGRQVFWFTVLGLYRTGENSTPDRFAGEMPRL